MFPGDKISIRSAKWTDLDSIMAIETEANPHHPWPQIWFEKELTRSYSRFFIAELEEKVVGYCVWWLAPYRAEILNVATRSENRRRGVARELLKVAIESAKKAALETVDLEVRVDNDHAIAFYQGLGFEKVGSRQAYYRDGTDALLMTRRLL